MLLDGLDTKGAVAAGAREHDANGELPLVFGQCREERIDRRSFLAIGVFANAQVAFLHAEDRVGRGHIDVIAAHRLVVLGRHHRNAGIACQDFRQHALPLRGEMGDHDKRHAGIGRHSAEQGLERFHAARRSADADDWEVLVHSVTTGKGGRGPSPRCRSEPTPVTPGFKALWVKSARSE